MPIFLREYGPSVAFGIPGLLMAVATVIFWAGRNKYVHVPPATSNPHSFLRVVRTALFAQGSGRMGLVVAGPGSVLAMVALAPLPGAVSGARSDERRVGKEGVRPGRYRGAPHPPKKHSR